MIRKKKNEIKKEIEKALKDYAFDNSIQNEEIIARRNNLLEKKIHKKNDYLNGKATEKEKRQAYKKFREDYSGLGYGTPPTYQEFIKHPQLSPYDHMMNSKEVASDCMEEQKSNNAKRVVKEKYARNDYLKDKHTETEKKEAYKEFVEICSEFEDFSLPSYDEFIQNPTFSVYDYLKRDSEMDSNYNVVIDKKYLQNDYLKGKNTEREKEKHIRNL